MSFCTKCGSQLEPIFKDSTELEVTDWSCSICMTTKSLDESIDPVQYLIKEYNLLKERLATLEGKVG